MPDDAAGPRKLFAGALISLLLSLTLYACLVGALAFHYYAATFLAHPEIIYGPPPPIRLMNYLLGMAYAVPVICLWWLVAFLAAWHRRAVRHQRFARADLWLLLVVTIWALMLHAMAMEVFPRRLFPCGGGGFTGICAGPRWDYFWSVVGIAAALFVVGLAYRLRETGPDGPLDMDVVRNNAVAAWIDPRPSEPRLSRYLARLSDDVRGDVERSVRDLYAIACAWLDEGATIDPDEDPEGASAALEAHLEAGFPWLSKASQRRVWASLVWYS